MLGDIHDADHLPLERDSRAVGPLVLTVLEYPLDDPVRQVRSVRSVRI
jgi:hypothetical protein